MREEEGVGKPTTSTRSTVCLFYLSYYLFLILAITGYSRADGHPCRSLSTLAQQVNGGEEPDTRYSRPYHCPTSLTISLSLLPPLTLRPTSDPSLSFSPM